LRADLRADFASGGAGMQEGGHLQT